ncbi:unnamed protein product [Phaeothamnion confervicola]
MPPGALLCVIQMLEAMYHLAIGRDFLYDECVQDAVASFEIAWSPGCDEAGSAAASSPLRTRLGAILLLFQRLSAMNHQLPMVPSPVTALPKAHDGEAATAVPDHAAAAAAAAAAAGPADTGAVAGGGAAGAAEATGQNPFAAGPGGAGLPFPFNLAEVLTTGGPALAATVAAMAVALGGLPALPPTPSLDKQGDAAAVAALGTPVQLLNCLQFLLDFYSPIIIARELAKQLGLSEEAFGCGGGDTGAGDRDAGNGGDGSDGGNGGDGTSSVVADFLVRNSANPSAMVGTGKVRPPWELASRTEMEQAALLSEWCFRRTFEELADTGLFLLVPIMWMRHTAVAASMEYNEERGEMAAKTWSATMALAPNCPGLLAFHPVEPLRACALATTCGKNAAAMDSAYETFKECWGVCQRNAGGCFDPAARIDSRALIREKLWSGKYKPIFVKGAEVVLDWSPAEPADAADAAAAGGAAAAVHDAEAAAAATASDAAVAVPAVGVGNAVPARTAAASAPPATAAPTASASAAVAGAAAAAAAAATSVDWAYGANTATWHDVIVSTAAEPAFADVAPALAAPLAAPHPSPFAGAGAGASGPAHG